MSLQVIPRSPGIGEMLGAGLGQGIGLGLAEQLKQHKTKNELAKISQLESPQERMDAIIGSNLSSEDKKLAVNAMLQQEKQEKDKWTPKKSNELKSSLKNYGISEEEASRSADLYGTLTKGGQTAAANMILDTIMRGESVDKFASEDKKVDEETGFEFPDVSSDIFGGMTSKEKVKHQGELYKDNRKDYDTITSSISKVKKEQASIGQLKRISESGKLPKGYGRINVDWKTGELRIPAAAKNAETELFVKTINDFTTKAKDSYGARVTNFELDRFLKRLPTLANTEQGRAYILEQMDIVNNLDLLEKESKRKVYDNYTLRKIDSQKADEISRDLRKDQEAKLMERYDTLLDRMSGESQKPITFDKMPSPSKYKGYIMTNDEDGKTYKSDGKTWKAL